MQFISFTFIYNNISLHLLRAGLNHSEKKIVTLIIILQAAGLQIASELGIILGFKILIRSTQFLNYVLKYKYFERKKINKYLESRPGDIRYNIHYGESSTDRKICLITVIFKFT